VNIQGYRNQIKEMIIIIMVIYLQGLMLSLPLSDYRSFNY